MHRLALLVSAIFIIGGHATADITTDASFDEGKWEFRYLHKASTGGLPTWKVAVREEEGGHGSFLRIGDEPRAAGTVLVGQRVTLPEDLALLTLSLDYQTFCRVSDRSGMIDVAAYAPEAWDALPDDPKRAKADAPEPIFREQVVAQGNDVTRWRHLDTPLGTATTALRPFIGKQVVLCLIWTTWHEGTDEWAQFDNVRFHLTNLLVKLGTWPRSSYSDRPVRLGVHVASRLEPVVILEVRQAGEGTWRAVPMESDDATDFATPYVARLAGLPAGETECRVSVKAGEDEMTTDPQKISLTKRPPHPHVFYSPEQIEGMKQRIANQQWAGDIFAPILRNADSWLERDEKPPQEGGGWSHDYTCGECGARLKFDVQRPLEHFCPTCEVYRTGRKLDRVWIGSVHGQFADGAVNLGLAYAITGDERYARRGARILLDYAELFPKLPVNTGPAGRGRVHAQSLTECSWLLTVMRGYDLLYNGLTDEERIRIEEELIRPDVYARFPYSFGIHNIQCWHNTCYAAAGYLLGDDALIDRSLNGRIGFYEQIKQGLLDDGMWYERSMGYHYYTLGALMQHCDAARHNGLNLQDDPKIKRMFLLPLRLSQPDLVPPSLSDQGYRSSRIDVEPIERALGWYGDDEFARVLAYMYATGSKRNSRAALEYGGELPEQAEAPGLPSANLTGTGVAILRDGEGDAARWALLRYGEHGGGHGHPDKLEIIMYGLGRTLMPDLGNPGYGVKLHAGYYKTTPGHNTVTLESANQKGTTGECLAFHGEGPVQVAVGESRGAYAESVLRRSIVLGPGWLVDVYRVEAPEPAQIDYVLRCFGKLAITPEGQVAEGTLGDQPGYRYMNYVRRATPDERGGWQAVWSLDKPADARVHLTGLAAEGCEVLHVDAPGVPGRDHMDTLILRSQSAAATFVVVHQTLEAGAQPLPVASVQGGVAVGRGSERAVVLCPDLARMTGEQIAEPSDDLRVLRFADGRLADELTVPIARGQ